MSKVPTLRSIVLDCPEPERLARFYSELLDWGEPEADGDGSWVDLRGPDGVKISFQRVEGYRPPEWPGQNVPQQLHLDLTAEDLSASRERTLSLGAKLLDASNQQFHVYADPDGHPFCLCVP
ncbi:VOC family protein [Amycolatopsis pithecellobii]|uniref:VOC family protein n=1 Tax=Amycolatopsis pithecellobii TaxID=664692 RepID=A0A6N7ZAH1_9PSEU|nr:VOC family protein [Amycolatopsis pithecellobii]MTD58720.1 VOC family protein [Amycolatopsis pithecellobii]